MWMEREELAELERLWCPELPFPPPRVGDWGRPGGTNDALANDNRDGLALRPPPAAAPPDPDPDEFERTSVDPLPGPACLT